MALAGHPGIATDSEIARFAAANGISQTQAMQALLQEGIWPQRFARNRDIFTPAQQSAMLDLHVLIAGCGGLGGWIADFLARLGVGHLRLCDPDIFEESNLNRQRFCRVENMGRPKVECAARELRNIAPYLTLEALQTEANPETLPRLLQGMTAAVDCLDSIPRKKMLENACARAQVPYLHGAVLEQDAFIYLDIPGRGRLDALYPDTPAAQKGTGGSNVLVTTVAGTAVIMTSLLVNCLILGKSVPDAMLHADFSAPALDRFSI